MSRTILLSSPTELLSKAFRKKFRYGAHLLELHNTILLPIDSQMRFLMGFWRRERNFGRYSIVSPGRVSGRRVVPPLIPHPPYSDSGEPLPTPFTYPEVKDEAAISGMRRSCELARNILNVVGENVLVGRTTDELDAIAHDHIIKANAYPSPLNYRGFPKSICTSVNNVCCHGIPDDRQLVDGDIINIDITVFFQGYHGDCSKTYAVGNVDEEGLNLILITELCLEEAVAVCGPGVAFHKIGYVIESLAQKHGYTVLPAFLGHGIGSYFHGPPEVQHVGNSCSYKMEVGNTFTIEPVLSQGSCEVELLEDGWSCITGDGARSAQCEHTVLITSKGVEVLTNLNKL